MKHSVWVPMARRIASPGTVRFSRRTTKMKRYPVLRAIKNEIKCAPFICCFCSFDFLFGEEELIGKGSSRVVFDATYIYMCISHNIAFTRASEFTYMRSEGKCYSLRNLCKNPTVTAVKGRFDKNIIYLFIIYDDLLQSVPVKDMFCIAFLERYAFLHKKIIWASLIHFRQPISEEWLLPGI